MATSVQTAYTSNTNALVATNLGVLGTPSDLRRLASEDKLSNLSLLQLGMKFVSVHLWSQKVLQVFDFFLLAKIDFMQYLQVKWSQWITQMCPDC